jgi:hypothetical protein
MIFIIAFTSITGAFVVALLTMGMSEPVHFYAAAGLGAVVALVASWFISKQMKF